MSKPSGTDQSSRSRRARPSFTAALVWLLAVLVAAGLFGFWPARRNYYFKRSPAPRQLDVPYQSGVSDPKQSSTYIYQAAGCLSPMVVFVHGGYSRALDRRWLEPVLGTFGNIGVSLAERGVGAAIIGYRQYPSIQHAEDSLTDIAAAIRFVRDSCPARFVELPGLGHNQIMIGIGMDHDPIVPLLLAFMR